MRMSEKRPRWESEMMGGKPQNPKACLTCIFSHGEPPYADTPLKGSVVKCTNIPNRNPTMYISMAWIANTTKRVKVKTMESGRLGEGQLKAKYNCVFRALFIAQCVIGITSHFSRYIQANTRKSRF
jgi:hypothetical protein